MLGDVSSAFSKYAYISILLLPGIIRPALFSPFSGRFQGVELSDTESYDMPLKTWNYRGSKGISITPTA